MSSPEQGALNAMSQGSLFFEIRGGCVNGVIVGKALTLRSPNGGDSWLQISRWMDEHAVDFAVGCVDCQSDQMDPRVTLVSREAVVEWFARTRAVPTIVFDWETTFITDRVGRVSKVGRGEKTRSILRGIFPRCEVLSSAEELSGTGTVKVFVGETMAISGLSGSTQPSEILAALEDSIVFGAICAFGEVGTQGVWIVGVRGWHKRAAQLWAAVTGCEVSFFVDDLWPARLLEYPEVDPFIRVSTNGGERGPRGRYRSWLRVQERVMAKA